MYGNKQIAKRRGATTMKSCDLTSITYDRAGRMFLLLVFGLDVIFFSKWAWSSGLEKGLNNT